MRDLYVFHHVLVAACFLNLFVGTAVAAPQSNVHPVKKLSDDGNPRGFKIPFSLLVEPRDRRETGNYDAESAPGVQRRAVDSPSVREVFQLLTGDDMGKDERQKREVEKNMVEDEGYDRMVRDADVIQLQEFDLELNEDDSDVTADGGLLQRIKRMSGKKKKKKDKKSKKKKKKSKQGPKKTAKGKKPNNAKKSNNSKKKAKNTKKKPTKMGKKQSQKGKKQAPKKGKKKPKKAMNKKPKSQDDMSTLYKLKSVKPLFLTCVLHSLLEETTTQEMSKYLGPLAYLLMASGGNLTGNGSMMNTSMESMMAMNDSSMMSQQSNNSMMNSTIPLASLLNPNMATVSPGHYYYTFGESALSYPVANLPLMNFGNLNITDSNLMHVKELLEQSMSLLLKKEGTEYDVDDFIMALDMDPQNVSMPGSKSMEKDDPHMICSPFQNDLLSEMNGLMTKNLVNSLNESLMALLTNDTGGFVRELLSEADKSFEILYLMRFTGKRYEDHKTTMLLSCIFESLLDEHVGREIMIYLIPYLTNNMMMAGNGTMLNNNSMMENSSMSEMMNNMMTMLPMNESNSTAPMPSFNLSTIMDSQYCQDNMTDPKMIFMYVMNMTNINMSQMNMSMAADGMNMTMTSPMASLNYILAMLKRSTNESLVNAQTAPSLLLPAILAYLDTVPRIYLKEAIRDAVQHLINYDIDMESGESSMEDMMESMNGTNEEMMNMSSSMNTTTNATSSNETMTEMDGMHMGDVICPAMVMEFLPQMEIPARVAFFRRFLRASKFLLCGDIASWLSALEMDMMDSMEEMNSMEEMDSMENMNGGGTNDV